MGGDAPVGRRPGAPEAAYGTSAARSGRHGVRGRMEALELPDTPPGRRSGTTPEGTGRRGRRARTAPRWTRSCPPDLRPRATVRRAPITAARHQLDEYFAGRRAGLRRAADSARDPGLPREGVRATAASPTAAPPPREVATRAGKPRAVRAAGTALATDPIPILVPCRRGAPRRTAGPLPRGAQAKARLLELRRAMSTARSHPTRAPSGPDPPHQPHRARRRTSFPRAPRARRAGGRRAPRRDPAELDQVLRG